LAWKVPPTTVFPASVLAPDTSRVLEARRAPEAVMVVAERAAAVVVARFVTPETESWVLETFCRLEAPVATSVATWRLPVPVALVKVRPLSTETPVTEKFPPTEVVPETESWVEETFCKLEAPVATKVAACRFPVPVAFVKLTPAKVEEPLTVIVPTTCSVELGAEVPIPTLVADEVA
jgi:hypothetical protein